MNSDGNFDDADETLLVVNNKKGTVTADITIPSYATGSTRMRIAMRNNSAPSACDSYFDGEVKDYPVSFETAPQASNLMTSYDAMTEEFSVVQIYPNPVSKTLIVRLDAAAPGDNFTIYNMNGGIVKYDKILSAETAIDLTGYSPGMYLVVVENDNRMFRKKIAKN